MIDSEGPRYTYQDQSFKLNWAEVSDAAAKRLFGDDKKRMMEINNILSIRPDKFVDLRDDMSGVRAQGERGTCSHFATMALVEHFIDKTADYSEQCLTFFVDNDDSGSMVENISHIEDSGVYYEVEFPYVDPGKNDKWILSKEEERKELALQARNTIPDLQSFSKKHLSFEVELQDVDELSDGEYIRYILDKLDHGIPVEIGVYVAGTAWERGMITAIPSEEEIKEKCKGEVNTGSIIKKCSAHAVVLTGYSGKEGLIYFKNSWDKTWGLTDNYAVTFGVNQTGYGAFSFAYLAKFRLDNMITLSH